LATSDLKSFRVSLGPGEAKIVSITPVGDHAAPTK